jgi:hypothetical protein
MYPESERPEAGMFRSHGIPGRPLTFLAMILITWTTADGEEREERWPSVERFRAWASAQSGRISYTAYQEDADGDWVVIDKGRVNG